MDNGEAQQVYLGAAALVISLVALFATVLQIMQQFVSTANGYHRVGESAMSYWGMSRKMRWDFRQFRAEVKFSTPVLFVCPPTNTRFPFGPKAWFIDSNSQIPMERDLRRLWDPMSWWRRTFGERDWWWEEDEDTNRGGGGIGGGIVRSTPLITSNSGSTGLLRQFWRRSGKTPQQRRWTATRRANASVHTTKEERAGWVRLLDGIQIMEEQSAHWQSEVLNASKRPPTSTASSTTSLTSTSPDLTPSDIDRAMGSRTMAVALQPVERSWDTMPTSVTKPYASTTMCHLVEMLAMLNVYWSEFDRLRDRYRAEGNGFLVIGEQVADLGLVFTVNYYAKNRFEENRLIPVDAVKDLCFGRVSTIYSWAADLRRIELTEIDTMASLQMSTNQEIAESLRVLGCNAKTVNIVLENKRTTHLFPLAFELVGMLSQTLHMHNTLFRFLPNPTKFTWDRRAFSMRQLLHAYQDLLAEHCENNGSAVKSHLLRILAGMQPFLARLVESTRHTPELGFLEYLHNSLDDMDEILTARRRGAWTGDDAKKAATNAVKLTSPDLEKPAPDYTETDQRRKMVQDVLRNHIQTVLYVLNRDEEDMRTPRMSRHAMSIEIRYDIMPEHLMLPGGRAEDIDHAPPEGDRNKQKVLMDIYFMSIRPYVVDQSRGTTDERTRWEASLKRDYLNATPLMPHGSPRHHLRPHGQWSAAPSAAPSSMPPPPRQGVQKAPTEPSSPPLRSDEFQPPPVQRTWTLPSRTNTGSASSGRLSLRRGEGSRDRSRPRWKKPSILVTPGSPVIKATTSPTESERPRDISDMQQQPSPPATNEIRASVVEAPPQTPPPVASTETAQLNDRSANHNNGRLSPRRRHGPESLADLKDVSHDDIWCVLVLRMLCWLSLHEFHPKDKQTPNSELLGSRLPVFIT